jgi:carbamoylphosphate synthase large subunit
MAGWSRFCIANAQVADHVQSPSTFVRDVASLVERWSIDVVLPCHEDSLALRRHESQLPTDVKLACPTLQLLEMGVDKADLTQLAMAAGVKVPESRFPSDIDEAEHDANEIGFPVVVKLRRSNSAKGVSIVHDPEALRATLDGPPFVSAMEEAGGFPILQAFLAGDVVGGCFLACNGQLTAFFGERYLRVKSQGMGTSTVREPFFSDDMKCQVERLVEALAWEGIGHFDFIESPETGELSLLEMNPRLWGALNLAQVNGYDFPAALVAHTLGESRLDRFFAGVPSSPKRSLWLLGEGIRFLDLLRSRQWREALRVPLELLGSLRHTRYDDWQWHDPLPLLAEMLCYGRSYFRSGGSMNPGAAPVQDVASDR